MPASSNLLLAVYVIWISNMGWIWRSVGSDLIVIRKVNGKDVYHKDRFNIPRSRCTDIRQGNKCIVYGGFERTPNNPCKCLCPPLMGTLSRRQQRWHCTSNQVIRSREGCGFYFQYESSKSYVKILRVNKWHFFHAPSLACNLHTLNSSYLSCNGSWLTIPNLGRYVDVISRGFDQVARSYAYQIRVKENILLSGKLVKLSFTCNPFGGKPCLLVKIKGNQNCHPRKAKRKRKKSKKNKKEASVLALGLPIPTANSESRISHGFPSESRPIKNDTTRAEDDESRLDKSGEQDGVPTAILTFAAVLLAAIVLVLAVNLFFCSSQQNSYSTKHSFQRSKGHTRLRTTSSVSTKSSNTSDNHSIENGCLANNHNKPYARDSTEEVEEIPKHKLFSLHRESSSDTCPGEKKDKNDQDPRG